MPAPWSCNPGCPQCAATAKRAADRQGWARRREARRKKAVEVLQRILDDDNWKRFRTQRFVIIKGSHGGEYRLNAGSFTGNITRYNSDGAPILRICAHPNMGFDDELPWEAAFVAQILMIRADEPGLYEVAESSYLGDGW